jgi:hypothetical protein
MRIKRCKPAIPSRLRRAINTDSGVIQPEYVGVDEAQELTGISKWTWRVAAYQGRVESCKIGNRLLIPLSEIRRLIREGTRPRRDGLPAGVPSANHSREAQVGA